MPDGWTQQHMDSTATALNRLLCMQLCMEDEHCMALNYYPDTITCELTSLILADTGIQTFSNSGGFYLEKVHPLIAQSL